MDTPSQSRSTGHSDTSNVITSFYQDWFTSLYYSHPGMFHVLPCRFNRQTSIQYLQPPMEQHFELFHACEPKSENVITHTNGCGPYPGACHIEPESANYTGTYWKTHSSYMEVRGYFSSFYGR